jgi:tRNA N6-adenosine threonylcarbamoyltransferase
MWILGIETSCDETSVALIDGEGRILSNSISSQVAAHAVYGGVVPEIASRHHLTNLEPVFERAFAEAGRNISEVSLICATAGPGLVGALLVGLSAAKALAFAHGIPFQPVNHLEGHLYSPFLATGGRPARPVVCPFHGLVVSGGHSELVRIDNGGLTPLARTRDDAPGEVFDKIARRAGLGYPGGPLIDRIARRADGDRFRFTIGRFSDGSLDFTFSGLKTAVLRELERLQIAQEPRSEQDVTGELADVLASFQRTVVRTLLARVEDVSHREPITRLALSGGVAANSELRDALTAWGRRRGIETLLSERALTTDNAAMIAWAGWLAHRKEGVRDHFGAPARSRWPLGLVSEA